MKDIQNCYDSRNIEIDKVGVKDIKYPIVVLDKRNGFQNTIANINIFVNLPREFKGTHMSRFVEILNERRGSISVKNLPSVLEEIKERLNAESAHIEIQFPYFIEKEAPISKSRSLMEYSCTLHGISGKKKEFFLTIEVPITTVCPCSKEISSFGAHSQRGRARLKIKFLDYKRIVWIEDLIEIVEECASSDIYALLKRSDEKFVTEKAYSNPKFVEDVARDIAGRIMKSDNIAWFSVEVENFESIHNHSAYAYLERDLLKDL